MRGFFLGLALIGLTALGSNTANADPVLGAGWASDQIDAASPTPSLDSPYDFVLAGPATFTITDAFIVGDTYFVYDAGVLILTTAFGTLPPFPVPTDLTFDTALGDAGYSKGQVLLGPGAHSITVTGDGVGGLPAGFGVRLDVAPVPEPTSIAVWSLIAAVGLAAGRRLGGAAIV